MRAPLKRYYIKSIIPFVIYLILLFSSASLVALSSSKILKAVFALSPLLPIAVIFYYYFLYLAECDELERKIEMDAMAISAMLGLLTGMALLFLLEFKILMLTPSSLLLIMVCAISAGYAFTRWLGMYRFRA